VNTGSQELKTGNEIQKRVNTELREGLAEVKGALKAMTPVEVREGQHAVALVKYVGCMAASAGLGAACTKLFGG